MSTFFRSIAELRWLILCWATDWNPFLESGPATDEMLTVLVCATVGNATNQQAPTKERTAIERHGPG